MFSYNDTGHSGFSAMTINLRFGLAADGPNNWVHRRKSFPALFEAFCPDFICMQEANDFQVRFFGDLLKDYYFIGQRIPFPVRWQDNLIFYKKSWRCIRHERFFLSETPTIPSKLPKSIWPRQCVAGMFEKGGKKLLCINTHFDFETSVQVESAKIIISRIKRKMPGAPAILMGDFNAEPHSPAYDLFTQKGTCDPPFREIHRDDYSCTFHGFTGNNTGHHIDWMMYRGGLKVLKKEIIRNRFQGYYPSDHFPVIALFEWPQADGHLQA